MTDSVYDVLVVGGGLCGFACAMRSVWSKKKVLIVERRPALGWESTYSGQLNFDGVDSEYFPKQFIDVITSKQDQVSEEVDVPSVSIEEPELLPAPESDEP